ncbi:Doublecortin, partial [Teladorsagia circumcincta]
YSRMTKERSSSNTRRPIDTSLSNSFSSGVSSLSSSNYGVRTVRVFKNGDPYHQGTKFVVNRRYVHDLDHMLNLLSEKIDLPYGAKRLFTTNGKLVRHLNDIEDKQDYVASSNQFIPLKYGNTTTSIGHPFRSTSPIKHANSPEVRKQESFVIEEGGRGREGQGWGSQASLMPIIDPEYNYGLGWHTKRRNGWIAITGLLSYSYKTALASTRTLSAYFQTEERTQNVLHVYQTMDIIYFHVKELNY